MSGQTAGFEAVKQRFAGNNAKILEIRVSRNKCRLKSMRRQSVVKARDADIIWDAHSSVRQSLDQIHRHDVVAGDDCIGRFGQ